MGDAAGNPRNRDEAFRMSPADRDMSTTGPGWPRRYRLVIFDFDGTLADSGDWFLSIADHLAERFGFRRVTPEEVEMLRGHTTREVLSYLRIPRWKLPAIGRYLHALLAEQTSRIMLFDGVDSLIGNLADAGMKIALVTSNSEANVRAILGPANVARIDWFECGASLLGKAPRYRRVLRRSYIEAYEAIAIGDETRDIAAARKAGVTAGAVMWGYAHRDALIRAAPDKVFEHPDEIARLLLGDSHERDERRRA
ncbi:hydrolase, haloacid dehalogenase-like family [hydrothermal vent metagenome]|uniref:Hydrolase, haloacid dehalogenase-like family n=1 Tax=hydrothermal vent metagenome TaxID=652676 RepID=A0A170PP82_9ZZZZ